MFTGIIEEIGVVQKIDHTKNFAILTVIAKKVLAGLKLGESIAINGVCLTVCKKSKTSIVFDVMKETLSATNIGTLEKGVRVNLERALKASDRFGGHFVTGHVDSTAKVKCIKQSEQYVEYFFNSNKTIAPYLVAKGSIAIDGISLTIGKVLKNQFSIHLIPFTLHETVIAERKVGDLVNIETDVLAKYIGKQVDKSS